MWCYVDRVLIPFQRAQSAVRGIPRGNLSDLYPRWLGARELLLHGRDPYGSDITREIQIGYYGRPLDPTRPNDPKDQQGFAYPLFVVFLLAPTVRLPFEFVQVAFRWLLLACIVISVPLWFHGVGQRVSRPVLLIWAIFSLGCFPAVQGIKLQQLTLLVCALIAGAFAAIVAGRLITAGVLLAVATIKPQLVLITCVWLLIWCLGEWPSRRRLFRGFATTMVVLLAGSNLLLPGWMSQFRLAAGNYVQYTGGGKSLLDVLLTPGAGKPVAISVALFALIVGWRFRRAPAGSNEFSIGLATVMTATLVVIPTYAPYNQLLLLPAAMVLASHWDWFSNKRHFLRVVAIVAIISVFWPWITAAMLDLALAIYPVDRVQAAWAVPLFTSLVIPLAILGAVAGLAISAMQQPKISA